MEAQAAFVRADRTVELHAETAVDPHVAVVVHPRDTEHNDAFGLDQTLEQRGFFVLGVGFDNGAKGFQHFRYGLHKFGFVGTFLCQVFQHSVDIRHG